MSLPELFILAVGLSMDAFAVAVCKGLSLQKMEWRHGLLAGLYFGGFQAAMPFLGYLLGVRFQAAIASVDHWIAFALLCLIGGGMIREALGKEDEDCDPSLAPAVMVLLAVATSIDALAVGITFAVLKVDVLPAVALIGACTFAISAAGVKIGNVFGARYKAKAELLGGVVLVLIGAKILLEHLELL